MIRVQLPHPLQVLADTGREIEIELEGTATLGAVLDRIEEKYPMLRGTIRNHDAGQRRPMIRYFVCEEDYSLRPPDTELPEAIREGHQAILVVGAIAGG